MTEHGNDREKEVESRLQDLEQRVAHLEGDGNITTVYVATYSEGVDDLATHVSDHIGVATDMIIEQARRRPKDTEFDISDPSYSHILKRFVIPTEQFPESVRSREPQITIEEYIIQ